jgi:hypothetical protein
MGFSQSMHRVSTTVPQVIHGIGVVLAVWLGYTPVALVLLLRRPYPQIHTPYYYDDYLSTDGAFVLEVWKREHLP